MPRFYGVPKTPEVVPEPAPLAPPFNQKIITTIGAETYFNSMILIPQNHTMAFHGQFMPIINRQRGIFLELSRERYIQ